MFDVPLVREAGSKASPAVGTGLTSAQEHY